MKRRRAMTRQLRCEALEGRLVLSVVPGLPTGAVVPLAAHNQAAAQVAKATVTVAPITNVSSNWSGYAVPGSSVSYVAGSWVVPTVSPKTNGYSAVWVGIDGYNSSTVEQIGTGEDVVNGQVSYYAWYEMYPAGSVTITPAINAGNSFTVNPGDKITASVAYVGGSFVLTIKDTTESETFTKTLTATGAAMSSAEWVVEAPSSNYGILPLANFGTVTFTNAYATIGGTTGPIDNWQSYSINMESRSQVEDSTSALSDTAAPSTDGFSGNVSSFTVTDNATTPVTPTPPTPTPPTPTPPTPTPPPPPQRHHHGWGGWDGWAESSASDWGWEQSHWASQITAGHSGSPSQLASLGEHFVRDQLFASSERFDLL